MHGSIYVCVSLCVSVCACALLTALIVLSAACLASIGFKILDRIRKFRFYRSLQYDIISTKIFNFFYFFHEFGTILIKFCLKIHIILDRNF